MYTDIQSNVCFEYDYYHIHCDTLQQVMRFEHESPGQGQKYFFELEVPMVGFKPGSPGKRKTTNWEAPALPLCYLAQRGGTKGGTK